MPQSRTLQSPLYGVPRRRCFECGTPILPDPTELCSTCAAFDSNSAKLVEGMHFFVTEANAAAAERWLSGEWIHTRVLSDHLSYYAARSRVEGLNRSSSDSFYFVSSERMMADYAELGAQVRRMESSGMALYRTEHLNWTVRIWSKSKGIWIGLPHNGNSPEEVLRKALADLSERKTGHLRLVDTGSERHLA